MDPNPHLPPPTTFGIQSKGPNITQMLSVIILCVVVVLMVAGSYYLGSKKESKNPIFQQVLTPTPVIVTITPTANNPLIVSSPQLSAQTKDDLKKTIKDKIEASEENGLLQVDAIDVSPTSSSAAFLAHDKNWSKYGLYLFDGTSNKVTEVYELKESITGRGGTYTDNVDVKFSPSGSAFFANKTGTNFPSFIVADWSGKVINKSNDLGNATWISENKLLYLISTDQNPSIFDITTKTSSQSQIPKGIFHLKANQDGRYVLGFTNAKKTLQCQSFDLLVFLLPDFVEVKSEPNVELAGDWVSEKSISFDKVTDCQKNTGESMFEYSSVSQKQEMKVE